AWPVDHVVTLVAKSFSEKAGPDVLEYLKNRSWSNDTVNKLMAWMTDNQATGEDGAKHFLKENKDIWTKWVSPEAAKKIEASL
ncbi:glycine betaine ABC transporter substrate-binding protein, partial [Rhizobium sp. BR 362]